MAGGQEGTADVRSTLHLVTLSPCHLVILPESEEERMTSQTERDRVDEAGRQGGDPFRLLVEGVKDYAIFMLDPHGRVLTWNAGAEHIKGYRAEEIVGQHFSRFYPAEAVGRG